MIVAYDGGAYSGWQDNGQIHSIEKALRLAIEQVLRHPVILQAASRTDTGVHAEGQVVNFFTPRDNLPLEALRESIQALAPSCVVIVKLWEADPTFHPTLDNLGKEYHYHLCYDRIQMPLRRHWEWHYPGHLEIQAMREASQFLVGTHDFRAFCNSRKTSQYESYVRTLSRISIEQPESKRLRIEVEGSSFLFRMARNLVGALVYVGCGKLSVDDVPRIIASQDRKQAGMTAPAHGLTLKRVFY